MILTIVAAVIVFGVLIAVHEAGHLAAAKAVGVTVHEFAIGMGPKLCSFTKGGTRYSLRLLPIGGYCSMEGEDESSENSGALCNKSPWARLLVMVAGALMNILLGFLLYILLYSCSGPVVSTNIVDQVLPGTPAEAAGFETGDKIIQVNGHRVHIPSELQFEMYKAGYGEMELVLERDGQRLTKTITPKLETVEGKDADGNPVSYQQYLVGYQMKQAKNTVFTVVERAFYQCFLTVRLVLYSFVSIFRGQVSFSDMSGPVGIVNEIGKSVQAGILDLVSLIALIAVNLGVFNLLPFPALDGGRVFFLLVELIRRKPIPPEREGIVHMIGMALLLLLMIAVTYQDIVKLFT